MAVTFCTTTWSLRQVSGSVSFSVISFMPVSFAVGRGRGEGEGHGGCPWVCPLGLLTRVYAGLPHQSWGRATSLSGRVLPHGDFVSFSPPHPRVCPYCQPETDLVLPHCQTSGLPAPWEWPVVLEASQFSEVSSAWPPHLLVFPGWPSNPSLTLPQLLEADFSQRGHW